MKKVSFVMTLLIGIMILTQLTGCDKRSKIIPDYVNVMIKSEYREKFLAEEFTHDDFDWNNIKGISYMHWSDNIDEPTGWLVVYLEKTGQKHVLNAVEHFNTLNFVKIAEPDYTVNTFK